jgi:KOW motif
MLEKGVRVRVLGGPFTGRVGVISELDGKGGARVTLGLLSARVPLHDLGPLGEAWVRPALKTSHRKPSPASGADDVRSEASRSRKTRPQKRPVGK